MNTTNLSRKNQCGRLALLGGAAAIALVSTCQVASSSAALGSVAARPAAATTMRPLATRPVLGSWRAVVPSDGVLSMGANDRTALPRGRPASLLRLGGGAAVLSAVAAGLAAAFASSRPAALAMATTTASKDVEVDYDALARKMLEADETTLRGVVMENMMALKPQFFERLDQLGIATRSPDAKKRYDALADKILAYMKETVEDAQNKVKEQGLRITRLVGICSEEDGTITLPLDGSKIARLREVISQELAAMSTDIFVNGALAFMAKAAQDKKPELVEVLQRILQAYAAESLLIMCPYGGQGAQPADIMMWNVLLRSEFSEWDALLQKEFFAPGARDSAHSSQ
eukprot:TRINITY_DN10657_c0_g1_i1.p1 TRINITY_DN10657_c0_g1~~TRINITY_DN10657_c0_g1_i1.p1  ORF type:complete len:359 (+),score=69.33 TRINITY_DN10657_c0_g1_i1:48-1079(+)